MHAILAKLDEVDLTIGNSADVTPEQAHRAHILLDELRRLLAHLPHGVGDVPDVLIGNG